MIQIRRSNERGHFDHGWLDTYHTFSFAGYHDSDHMGFRSLRVINEDRIQPGAGFGEHGHRNMEIITYVLDGALQHRDSMGNGSVLRPGTFQRMSAGTGVYHSEFNHSKTDPLHLYQIWLLPQQKGTEPGYEERSFASEETRNRFRLVASPDGRDGSLTIHQNANLYLATLSAGRRAEFPVSHDRYAWIQVVRGEIELNGQSLSAGDGAAVSQESALVLTAVTEAQVLVFDMV